MIVTKREWITLGVLNASRRPQCMSQLFFWLIPITPRKEMMTLRNARRSKRRAACAKGSHCRHSGVGRGYIYTNNKSKE